VIGGYDDLAPISRDSFGRQPVPDIDSAGAPDVDEGHIAGLGRMPGGAGRRRAHDLATSVAGAQRHLAGVRADPP
jgi:hypothetical protein